MSGQILSPIANAKTLLAASTKWQAICAAFNVDPTDSISRWEVNDVVISRPRAIIKPVPGAIKSTKEANKSWDRQGSILISLEFLPLFEALDWPTGIAESTTDGMLEQSSKWLEDIITDLETLAAEYPSDSDPSYLNVVEISVEQPPRRSNAAMENGADFTYSKLQLEHVG